MAFDLKETFTRKLGPLPTWAWVGGGAAIMLIVLKKKKTTAAGASSLLPSGSGFTPSSGTGGGSFGSLGGGSSGSSGSGGVTCPPGYALDANGLCTPLALAPPIVTQAPTPPGSTPQGNGPSPLQSTLAQLAQQWGLQPGGHFVGSSTPGSRIGWLSPNGLITYFQDNMPAQLLQSFFNETDPFTGQQVGVQVSGTSTPAGHVAAALSSGAGGAPAMGSSPANPYGTQQTVLGTVSGLGVMPVPAPRANQVAIPPLWTL